MHHRPIPPDATPVVVGVDPQGTEWAVDLGFLGSTWRCTWDRGCPGIGETEEPTAGLGCCSEGAELLDDDEARRIAALAAFVEPDRFQHRDAAIEAGIFAAPLRDGLDPAAASPDGAAVADRSDAPQAHRFTRVVDGACVFLNRPGFAGGHGCALHLQALADDEDPIEWKPSVCWQLPLRVERSAKGGHERAVLRRWRRADWGPEGALMASWCTETQAAYGGDRRVVESLAAELDALVGPEIAVAIRRAVGRDGGPASA